MPRITAKHFGLISSIVIATVGIAAVPVEAVATRPGVAAPAASSTTANDAKTQAKLKLTISRGDKEITRRLKTLNTLSIKITGAQKLSADNKIMLGNEVKDEISGLNTLKTKLDGATDLATAQADAQDIFSGYRVYALLVPKVQLVKTADDQQITEGKLTDLANKLQTRLTDAKGKGKDTASLQTSLDDLTAKANAAQALSSGVEAGVINLQPGDYNSDHTVLSGSRDKLKTAQDDIKAAVADARTVIAGLQKL